MCFLVFYYNIVCRGLDFFSNFQNIMFVYFSKYIILIVFGDFKVLNVIDIFVYVREWEIKLIKIQGYGILVQFQGVQWFGVFQENLVNVKYVVVCYIFLLVRERFSRVFGGFIWILEFVVYVS